MHTKTKKTSFGSILGVFLFGLFFAINLLASTSSPHSANAQVIQHQTSVNQLN